MSNSVSIAKTAFYSSGDIFCMCIALFCIALAIMKSVHAKLISLLVPVALRQLACLHHQSVIQHFHNQTCNRCELLGQLCSCFSSPIKRARTTSEIIWQGEGRDSSCIFLDSLKEAHLGWMEGMKQCESAMTEHFNLSACACCFALKQSVALLCVVVSIVQHETNDMMY